MEEYDDDVVDISEVLNEQVFERSKEIKKLEAGSEARSRAVKDFVDLYKLEIEQQKMVYENERLNCELKLKAAQNEAQNEQAERELELKATQNEAQNEQAERDLELKAAQDKDKKVERWIDFVKNLLILAATFGVSVWQFNRAMMFEETGTFCSTTGKSALKHLFDLGHKKI